MKKLFIITIIIFLCSGCFNYVEINDLVLISGIGIDYKDDKYIVSAEALYQNKENSDSNFEWGQVISASGTSLSSAFTNLSISLDKSPYYAHLKVVIISEEIANNHLNDLFDFFLRNNDIRNIFSLVVSYNTSPEVILSKSNEYSPVVSEKIKELLENNEYKNHIVKNLYFKDIASDYLTKNKDIALSAISISDEKPVIDRLIIFHGNKNVGYLDNNMSSTLSKLNNKNPNVLVKYECEKNKYITVNIYKSTTKYNIYKNTFNVFANLNGEIIENNCNIDLENIKEYKDITNKINKKIENDYKYLFQYLKNVDSDLLGINKKYFNKYRKRNTKYFKEASFNIKTNTHLNKKGLIFEVRKKWVNYKKYL